MNDNKPPNSGEIANPNAPTGGLSSPPLPDWLQRWLKLLDNHGFDDPIHLITLCKCQPVAKRLVDDIDVRNILLEYKDVNADGEKKVTAFLVQASVGLHFAKARAASRITPARLAVELPPIAKAARKLAKTIGNKHPPFRKGTDQIPYLLARTANPQLVFPTKDAGLLKQPLLREALLSFASALDAQATQAKSYQGKTKRVTAINLYLDGLIQESYTQLGQVPYGLLARIASIVIDDDIDESTVRKRPLAIRLTHP
jgi:hypothetical protein